MKKNYKNLGIILIAGIIALPACQKDDQFSPAAKELSINNGKSSAVLLNTFYSKTFPLGKGVVRAWVKENKDGIPVSVGVNLSEKALENLPEDPAVYVLELPSNKGQNFYTHVLLDWNPEGHVPPGIYDVPHFDVHFYIIPNEDRLNIEADDLAEFANAPSSQYIPSLYLKVPGGEPGMGAHWVDLLSPEFNGGTFTKTFIWGSYDGRFIFWEPMVTLDYLRYLKSNPGSGPVPIRQPASYQQTGYYATHYEVSYSGSPKEFSVTLLNLTYHEGE